MTSTAGTDTFLPDLHPAMAYIVIVSVLIVLSTALLLYLVNFGAPNITRRNVRRWIRSCYGRVVHPFFQCLNQICIFFRIPLTRDGRAARHRHRSGITQAARRRRAQRRREREQLRAMRRGADIGEYEPLNAFELRDLHEQDLGQDAQYGEENGQQDVRSYRQPSFPSTSRNVGDTRGTYSNLPQDASSENRENSNGAEATSSALEIARVYASPSIFRRSPESTSSNPDDHGFPIRGATNIDTGLHPLSAPALPTTTSTEPSSSRFARSDAPSPTSSSFANRHPNNSAATPWTPFHPFPPPTSLSSNPNNDTNSQTIPLPSRQDSPTMDSAKFRSSIASLANMTPLPPSPPSDYFAEAQRKEMGLRGHRRKVTEEEWIEQRRRFDEGVVARGEGEIEERLDGAGEGGRLLSAGSEEAAYWDVEAQGAGAEYGNGGEVDGREGERQGMETLQPMRFEGQRAYGELQRVEGILGGVERVVDRMAGGLVRWIDGRRQGGEGMNGAMD